MSNNAESLKMAQELRPAGTIQTAKSAVGVGKSPAFPRLTIPGSGVLLPLLQPLTRVLMVLSLPSTTTISTIFSLSTMLGVADPFFVHQQNNAYCTSHMNIMVS